MGEIHIEKPEIRTVSTKTRQCQTLRFYVWNGAGDLPTKIRVHCIAHGFQLSVQKDLGCLSTCWSHIILFYLSVFCKIFTFCFWSMPTLQGVLLALKEGSKPFWIFWKTFLHRNEARTGWMLKNGYQVKISSLRDLDMIFVLWLWLYR